MKDLCVAYDDGNWCRGEIVDILKQQKMMVYLLDYGRSVEVSAEKLCLLKYAHASIGPFAIKCRLSILNSVTLSFGRKKRKALCNEFQRFAQKSNHVCIYLNATESRKTDDYTNVLLFSNQPAKDKEVFEAYSLHEAYGLFYHPKVQFDDELCKLWFYKVNAMEKSINMNVTRKIPVFLSHIVSPGEFYVQCEPVKWFMSKIRRIIDAVARAQMQNYDFNVAKWTIGDNCLVRMQNWNTKANLKVWYRGRIRSIDNGKFKIFLRDYGRSTEVYANDLMSCSLELAKCHNAVQKCTLDISKQWTAAGTDLLNSTVQQYASFAVSCVKKNKSHLCADLWATNSSAPDVSDCQMWANIGYTVVCTAIRNSIQSFILESQHYYNQSKRLRDQKNSGRILLSSDDDGGMDNKVKILTKDDSNDANDNADRNTDNDFYVINGDLLGHHPFATKWLKPTKIERNSFRGVVTHISDRGVIYIQEESNFELANDISAAISDEIRKQSGIRTSREWKVGDPCFAEYEKNQFHRAVIKRIYREYGTCLVSNLRKWSLNKKRA